MGKFSVERYQILSVFPTFIFVLVRQFSGYFLIGKKALLTVFNKDKSAHPRITYASFQADGGLKFTLLHNAAKRSYRDYGYRSYWHSFPDLWSVIYLITSDMVGLHVPAFGE